MPPADDALANFDFISDQKFKASLVSDYREILRCIESGAWKAVHVLAGSVVEALLIDYLLVTDYQKRKGTDPLKMDLATAIAACKSEGVLSDRASDLSAVVRGYRNLIHPGRVIRLNEKVNQQTATIAKALLDVIVQEVSEARINKCGFTAEQIAHKMQTDSSSFALLRHFLNDTHEHERERLVSDIIPSVYFAALSEEWPNFNAASEYVKWFRQAFETLSDEAKKRIACKFPKMLREDTRERIGEYERAFFRGSHVQYLPPKDKALVKEHLMTQFEREPGSPTLKPLDGIGPFLEAKELRKLTENYIRIIAYSKHSQQKNDVQRALYGLFLEVAEASQAEIKNAVESWIDLLEGRKGAEEPLRRVQDIKSMFEEDIPF